MARQGPRREYTEEFKRQAVERMEHADNIVVLAKELGIARCLLYQWEAGRGRAAKKKESPPDGESDSDVRRLAGMEAEVAWLREALAKRVKEVDFFKGALQRVEVRRQSKGSSGETASTTKSAK